jgi:3,4-dihydroxy 2-butanone 4-phosphate synthase/GTP cyclohydrolase II
VPEAHGDAIEAALAALREGRPVVAVDSADRENEADVILAAATATTDWVAWTIRHSSGYLCAPMPSGRADALDLPLMVPHSQDPRRTAYTVTVDASHGISTGISAADRAHTLRVLADPAAGPESLIRPGHVLPLRAVPGGVLHRAGHTEAAVDLCRLAGVGEVAGIAELVNDDGTMMRFDEAEALAHEYGLVMVTIADLIAYRRAHGDTPAVATAPVGARVEHVAEADLPTRYGTFRVHGYRDLRTGAEHAALVSLGDPAASDGSADGDPTTRKAPVVRVHSECLTGDAFGSLRCDCGSQLDASIALAAKEGGAVVYLRGHEGRGIGLLPKLRAYALQDQGRDTVQANLDLGWPADRREYSAAAAILTDLGFRRIRLVSNNPAKVAGLVSSGIEVTQVLGLAVGHNVHSHHYLVTKKDVMGHLLDWVSAEEESAS